MTAMRILLVFFLFLSSIVLGQETYTFKRKNYLVYPITISSEEKVNFENDIPPIFIQLKDGDYIAFFNELRKEKYILSDNPRKKADSTRIASFFSIKNGKLNGPVKWLDLKGKVYKKGFYKNGKRDSTWTFKDKNESKTCFYTNGLKEGTALTVLKQPKTRIISNYKKDLLDGTYLFISDKDTTVKQSFLEGKKHGLRKEIISKDPNVSVIKTYTNDILDSDVYIIRENFPRDTLLTFKLDSNQNILWITGKINKGIANRYKNNIHHFNHTLERYVQLTRGSNFSADKKQLPDFQIVIENNEIVFYKLGHLIIKKTFKGDSLNMDIQNRTYKFDGNYIRTDFNNKDPHIKSTNYYSVLALVEYPNQYAIPNGFRCINFKEWSNELLMSEMYLNKHSEIESYYHQSNSGQVRVKKVDGYTRIIEMYEEDTVRNEKVYSKDKVIGFKKCFPYLKPNKKNQYPFARVKRIHHEDYYCEINYDTGDTIRIQYKKEQLTPFEQVKFTKTKPLQRFNHLDMDYRVNTEKKLIEVYYKSGFIWKSLTWDDKIITERIYEYLDKDYSFYNEKKYLLKNNSDLGNYIRYTKKDDDYDIEFSSNDLIFGNKYFDLPKIFNFECKLPQLQNFSATYLYKNQPINNDFSIQAMKGFGKKNVLEKHIFNQFNQLTDTIQIKNGKINARIIENKKAKVGSFLKNQKYVYEIKNGLVEGVFQIFKSSNLNKNSSEYTLADKFFLKNARLDGKQIQLWQKDSIVLNYENGKLYGDFEIFSKEQANSKTYDKLVEKGHISNTQNFDYESEHSKYKVRNGRMQGQRRIYSGYKILDAKAYKGFLVDTSKVFYPDTLNANSDLCELRIYDYPERFIYLDSIEQSKSKINPLFKSSIKQFYNFVLTHYDTIDNDKYDRISIYNYYRKIYNKTGELYAKGKMNGSNPIGIWIIYDNQKKRLEVNFDSKEYEEFHPNGTQKISGHFTDFSLESDCNNHYMPTFHFRNVQFYNFWNNEAKQTLKNGTGKFQWNSNYGLPIEEGFYKDSLKTGLWKTYDNEGKLNSIGNYKNDEKDGVWYYGDLEGVHFTGDKCFSTSLNLKDLAIQKQIAAKKLEIKVEIYRENQPKITRIYNQSAFDYEK